MHHFKHVSWFFSFITVVHHFLRRPERCTPQFYVKSRLNSCVSFVLDPIGDRNDVYRPPPNRWPPKPGRGGPPYQAGAAPHTRPGRPPIPGPGGPPYQAGAAWPMPRTGPGRPAHALPHVRGPWGPRPRGRGGGPRKRGPAERAEHMGRIF